MAGQPLAPVTVLTRELEEPSARVRCRVVLSTMSAALRTLTPSPSSSELVTRLMGERAAVEMFTPARVRSALTPASMSMVWAVPVLPAAMETVRGVEVMMCRTLPSKA